MQHAPTGCPNAIAAQSTGESIAATSKNINRICGIKAPGYEEERTPRYRIRTPRPAPARPAEIASLLATQACDHCQRHQHLEMLLSPKG
jgi:hypothetical protein